MKLNLCLVVHKEKNYDERYQFQAIAWLSGLTRASRICESVLTADRTEPEMGMAIKGRQEGDEVRICGNVGSGIWGQKGIIG